MDDNTRIDGDDATRSVQVLDGGVNLLGLGATTLERFIRHIPTPRTLLLLALVRGGHSSGTR